MWILKVGVYDSFGEDAFRVRIDPEEVLYRHYLIEAADV